MQSISDNDKNIIDAMFGKESMRPVDIKNASGVSHSSVLQRLAELQKEEKGPWVIKNPDGTYQLAKKERPWIDE